MQIYHFHKDYVRKLCDVWKYFISGQFHDILLTHYSWCWRDYCTCFIFCAVPFLSYHTGLIPGIKIWACRWTSRTGTVGVLRWIAVNGGEIWDFFMVWSMTDFNRHKHRLLQLIGRLLLVAPGMFPFGKACSIFKHYIFFLKKNVFYFHNRIFT